MELPSAPVTTAHGKWQIVGFLKASQTCLTGLGRSECGSRPKGFKPAEEFVLGSKISIIHLILSGHTFVQICRNHYCCHHHLSTYSSTCRYARRCLRARITSWIRSTRTVVPRLHHTFPSK